MPTKMKDNPLWISVTDLMLAGAGKAIAQLMGEESLKENVQVYLDRINAIDNIKKIDLHIEEVTGEDKTVDIVVDIFNQVNSGGTKLSKGDLALAKICAGWPDARNQLNERLTKWRKAGFYFKLDWLLRVVNTLLTGEAKFTALKDVSITEFQAGLVETEKIIDKVLNLISGRLGLDHNRVLGSRYSLPLITRYVKQRGGLLKEQSERDLLLYWYIHTLLWGRYSGSTESYLNRDLELIEGVSPTEWKPGLDALIGELRTLRGDLRLSEADFKGTTRGARFYPLLYMMTRVSHARDWGTGDELNASLLGNLNCLQIHHIFPKARLREHGYTKAEINAIANFTFLTQETNLRVSDRDPAEYIPAFEKETPGAIATHWIPMDPELWKVENYLDFLAERRKLLADSANAFLDQLRAGSLPDVTVDSDYLDRVAATPGGFEDEDEEEWVRKANTWVINKGCASGDLLYDLTDQSTGDSVAVLDLAWPDGLQEGLSQPVALMIEEDEELVSTVRDYGFRCFTTVKDLKSYVKKELMAQSNNNHDDEE